MSRINHPQHYGGDTQYEAIKVIEAWEAGFCLGNTLKYIARAGLKKGATDVEDLEKARWYLDREIQRRIFRLRRQRHVQSRNRRHRRRTVTRRKSTRTD